MRLCVFHLLAGLWAVKVSVVSLYKVCRASCVSCRLISKQQLTSDAAAVKRTAVFTTGFGAAVEGSKSEHTTSCDWSFGTRRVDECLNNERSVKIPSCDNVRNSGSQDCCWRTILCEGVQGSSSGFFGNLLGKGLKSGCRLILKKIQRPSSTSVKTSAAAAQIFSPSEQEKEFYQQRGVHFV